MRIGKKPLKSGLLGGYEQNLAYAYNAANQHGRTVTKLQKTADTRTK
jgi:hypothetical protein